MRLRSHWLTAEVEVFHNWDELLELRNLVEVADLIITCAQRRRGSRGLHYTLDFPAFDPFQ